MFCLLLFFLTLKYQNFYRNYKKSDIFSTLQTLISLQALSKGRQCNLREPKFSKFRGNPPQDFPLNPTPQLSVKNVGLAAVLQTKMGVSLDNKLAQEQDWNGSTQQASACEHEPWNCEREATLR